MAKLVGQPIKRVEDPRFIQGKGGYVANISLPGMAYVALKRSPYAHANIKGIDASKARALPGVLAVYVGQDLIDGGCGKLPCGWNVPNIKVPARWAITPDKVRHVGDTVAAIVATSPYIAEDALDLIEVDYEVLPAVVGAKAAASSKTLVHDEVPGNMTYEWPLGDRAATEAALNAADHVVELDLINQRLIPNAMEPRACVAQWNKFTEEMTVWTTSQNPHPIRLLLSAFTLGIPENRLRVISPDVGGGFGSKIFHYPEEIIVPWVSKQLGIPCKWVSTRSEASITDSQGRDHVTSVKLGVMNDGTFTSLLVETYADHGAYISTFAPLIPTAFYHCLLSGCYNIPVIHGVTYATLTNTVPVDAYRGAGRPEAAYVIERMVDLAAVKLGMDKVAIRTKNFVMPDQFPFQTAVVMTYDSGNYPGMLAEAKKISNYPALVKMRDDARAAGKIAGVGIATCIEASGPAPSKIAGALGSAVGFWESAQIRVHPTGKVSLMTGSHTHGQGHETAFAQLVADQLGIPMGDVEIIHGDTGKVPFGMGSYGSRSLAVGGSAIVKSAEKVRDKMKKIAAHQLEAAVEDIEFDQDAGKLYVKGAPGKSKSIFDVSLAAYTAHNLPDGVEPGLEETSFYDPSNFTFPSSCHIVYVEIDKDTGETHIKKYFAVEDVGNVVNPMIVEGQVQGGIVQGVGQALYEYGNYDENGQLLTATFMDYAMPKAQFFPMIESSRIVTPSPHNPLGAKGAGEMGTITSTVAVANAVADALGPMGVHHIDLPLTPEKVWKAINSK
jgi:aerobic carbon-monoxide dehydrogenase large subunit